MGLTWTTVVTSKDTVRQSHNLSLQIVAWNQRQLFKKRDKRFESENTRRKLICRFVGVLKRKKTRRTSPFPSNPQHLGLKCQTCFHLEPQRGQTSSVCVCVCVCVCACVCMGVGLCVFERAKRKRLLEMVDEFKIHVSYMKCKKWYSEKDALCAT